MPGQGGFVGSAFAETDITGPLLEWECQGLLYLAELGMLVIPEPLSDSKEEAFCLAALFTAKTWAEPGGPSLSSRAKY